MKVIAYRKSLALEVIAFSTLLTMFLTIFIKFLSEDNMFAIIASLLFIILFSICIIDLLKTKKELILYDEENKVLWVFHRHKYHDINLKDILLMQKESIRVKWSETKIISFYFSVCSSVNNITLILEGKCSLRVENMYVNLITNSTWKKRALEFHYLHHHL